MRYATLCCCLMVFIHGCAARNPYFEPSSSSENAICYRWLESIESKVEEYNTQEPETVRVKGFPQLRANRFLASMSDQTTSMAAFIEWLEQMRQLGSTAISFEFANLPTDIRKELFARKPIGNSFEQALGYCGKTLNKISAYNPSHKKILLEQVKIPDSYQSWKRIIGFYPIAKVFAAIGIDRLHRELDSSFKIPPEKLQQQGKLLRYMPPESGSLTPESISAMMRSGYGNHLGIPNLTILQIQRLLAHFAPIWVIDSRNDTDKIGKVNLGSQNQPKIETHEPTVYVKHSFARWKGKVLLQLIYQVWLTAREKTGFLDLYGGSLDSVIWPVTLSPEGKPIAFDSIHACGCYYIVVPEKPLF
jgi:hypothetical protein